PLLVELLVLLVEQLLLLVQLVEQRLLLLLLRGIDLSLRGRRRKQQREHGRERESRTLRGIRRGWGVAGAAEADDRRERRRIAGRKAVVERFIDATLGRILLRRLEDLICHGDACSSWVSQRVMRAREVDMECRAGKGQCVAENTEPLAEANNRDGPTV